MGERMVNWVDVVVVKAKYCTPYSYDSVQSVHNGGDKNLKTNMCCGNYQKAKCFVFIWLGRKCA